MRQATYFGSDSDSFSAWKHYQTLKHKHTLVEILLHPAYFGPVDQFVVLAKADKVIFENEDNYQKQTYRNRQYIYGANGKLLLNIPIKHQKAASRHQKYKEVKIENSFHWQRDHWRSIQTAYRTSPFFEFYEDDFVPLFEKPAIFLLDFNYRCLETICSCLSLELDYSKTDEFRLQPKEVRDLRPLIRSKREKSVQMTPYAQVFEEKYGFLENLSILDLLFNEGTNTVEYLRQSS